MRVLGALPVIILARFIALSFAIPLSTDSTTTSPLSPRSNYCANAPNTVAGTPLGPRDQLFTRTPSLPPRALPNTPLWCAYGSSTYVAVTWGYSIAGDAVMNLLTSVQNAIGNHVARVGDHLVPEGFFAFADFGLELRMANANNHQQTWGVMNAGIAALIQFMERSGRGPGAVAWQVYDGQNMVGVGFLQLEA